VDRADQISRAQAPGFIINLAPTGIVPTRSMTRHVPVNHHEIVDDVASGLELGVQMVHLHARDAEERHSPDPEPYGRLIEAIRRLPGGAELVIVVTTSGRSDPGYEARARVLTLDGDMKPDMASLTLGSLNFQTAASVNEPSVVEALAARMAEAGIKPEVEIFDLGMANVATVLRAKGLLKGPVYANLLLGNIASAQTSLGQVAGLVNSLPADWILSAGGLGRSQLTANLLGLLYLDGVRTGLEDNIWLDNGRTSLATNRAQVQRLVRWGAELGRDLLDRQALRQRLALDAADAERP
jgi:uncharacterized protein (DUF849 family)